MRKLRLESHDREDSREARAILKGLVAYNRRFGGEGEWRELTVALKDARGKVVAGLNGYSDYGWLFVKLLWVSEEARGLGLGARLVARAESEARRRKCLGVWLDTFEFQAPRFYEKMGYRRFGVLEDYPAGYRRFFYRKRIRQVRRKKT